jgi:hypothetical protein
VLRVGVRTSGRALRAGATGRRKAGAARWEEALSWPAASLVAGSGREGWACASASGHHGRRSAGRREGEALRAVSGRGPKRRPRPATATCAVAADASEGTGGVSTERGSHLRVDGRERVASQGRGLGRRREQAVRQVVLDALVAVRVRARVAGGLLPAGIERRGGAGERRRERPATFGVVAEEDRRRGSRATR